MLPQKLAFVDVETTGLGVDSGSIIEVGILRVENNRIVETFQSLVRPRAALSEFSSKLTGISAKELQEAPVFDTLQEKIAVLLQDCIFVAHNAQFDYEFISAEFARLGKTFHAPQVCTVKLYKQLYPNALRHNLDSLIERFGFECERRHRAFDDAKVLFEFYLRLQRILPKEDLEAAIAQQVKVKVKGKVKSPHKKYWIKEKLEESA